MNKKVIKIVAMMLLILVIVLIGINAYAEFNFKGTISGIAKSGGDTNVTNPVKKIAGSAITIMKVAAAGIAVIMLIVLGMKYMTAAPAERASIKKSATIYIIGAIIMFATSGILGIIEAFSDNIKG